jgi:DNA-binding transcriptional MerR regulator
MKSSAQPRWTIDELGARTALALAVDYDGPPNDRVREVPDERTIRYYTTLGLIDRPAAMSGRTALYGRRHLLQLVAIKRLQAKGLSLAEIQTELLGLADPTLARLARVPAEAEAPAAVANSTRVRRQPARRRRADTFWRDMPAPPARGRADADGSLAASASGNEANGVPVTYQGIPVSDELTLLVASRRPLTDDDTQAVRTAAQPLLQLLQTRRLIGPRDERGTR